VSEEMAQRVNEWLRRKEQGRGWRKGERNKRKRN